MGTEIANGQRAVSGTSVALLDRLHGRHVHGRRVRVLARELSPLLPYGASVLDVGCGDGRLARTLADGRPDLRVTGVDVLVRPGAAIAVRAFDGRRLPFAADAFDVALCVDVLHHARDPIALLREAARVAPRVLLKDHVRDGLLAAATLRFMDRVGNARHGVALPYAYLSGREWAGAFQALGLRVDAWTRRVPLYVPPASWVFGRGLHFIALLTRT